MKWNLLDYYQVSWRLSYSCRLNRHDFSDELISSRLIIKWKRFIHKSLFWVAWSRDRWMTKCFTLFQTSLRQVTLDARSNASRNRRSHGCSNRPWHSAKIFHRERFRRWDVIREYQTATTQFANSNRKFREDIGEDYCPRSFRFLIDSFKYNSKLRAAFRNGSFVSCRFELCVAEALTT